MPRITEITGAQTPMSALLKDGLTQLSIDQHVTFNLYRKFISPLDGLVYWLRVKEGEQTATVRVTGGLRSKTGESKTSVQCVEGNIAAQDILGGWITNPKSAADQGQDTKAQVLRVSVTGPASKTPDAWTTEILPGDSFEIPSAPSQGVWVQSDARKHKFMVQVKRSIEPLSGQPVTIEQSGSLHYASETEQDEDTVSDTNTVMFTSKAEIRPFNLIGPNELYIGERVTGQSGDSIRFSFSSRGNYYEAADIWHYMGVALQSYMEPLIVEDPAGWEPDLFVTNSLPIWLTFPGYVPPYPGFVCPFPVHPSYLIPDNAKLPYAAIHVDETQGLQAVPSRGPRMQHDQLASDRVKATLYGASARRAADFYDFVIQFMRDAGKLGLMQEPPVMRDEHMKQPEYRILAQKKVIEFEVSYSQAVARDLARQLFDKDRVRVQLSPAPVPITPSPLLEPIVKSGDIDIDCPREGDVADAAGDREAVPRRDDADHDASHEAAAAPSEDRASSSRRARDAARERTAAGKRTAAGRRVAARRPRRGAAAESLAPEPAQ